MILIASIFVDFNQELFEKGIEAGIKTAEHWDAQWETVFGGESPGGLALYGSLTNIGEFFAVATLLLLVIFLIRDLNEGKVYSLDGLIWPLIVATLLNNNGALLANGTLAMRSLINTVNQQVLTTTLAGVNLNETYRQANGLGNLEQQIAALVQECSSKDGEELAQCLEQAQLQAQILIEEYQKANGASAWLESFQAKLSALFADGIAGGISNLLFSALLAQWQTIVSGLLYLLQIAYQHLLEASLLLTGLLGPIAVGSSLLPFGAKAIFAWMTGFFSVGIAKLSFNLVVGLASIVATSNEFGDPGWFPLFCGVFAPLLSAGLATGGGLAIWQSITTGVASVTSFVVKVAGSFV